MEKDCHKAATSPKNNLPEPSQKQKEAGNYKKGHITFQGIQIAIENPIGSIRKGADWQVTMKNHYGYIKGTDGTDGDELDVFVGPNLKSDLIFIIDQIFKGVFDEHKIMLGFNTKKEAHKAYLANFNNFKPEVGQTTTVTVEQFKKWIKTGDHKAPAFTQFLRATVESLYYEVLNLVKN